MKKSEIVYIFLDFDFVQFVFFIEDYKIEDYRTDFRPKNRGLHFQNRGLPGPILRRKIEDQSLFFK